MSADTRGDTVFRGIAWSAFACSANTACVDVKDGKVLRIQICQTDDEEERIPESRVVMATAYVQEFDEFYLVCDEKKMFYILPKSALASPAAELPEEASAESGADSEA